MDLILFASVSLAASSLGLPFFQLSKTRGRLPGYLLVVALAVALLFVASEHALPPASERLRHPAQLGQPRGPLRAGHPFCDPHRRRRLDSDDGREGQRASLLFAPLLLSSRHALPILLRRPADALRCLGAHEPPDLRACGVRQAAGGVKRGVCQVCHNRSPLLGHNPVRDQPELWAGGEHPDSSRSSAPWRQPVTRTRYPWSRSCCS